MIALTRRRQALFTSRAVMRDIVASDGDGPDGHSLAKNTATTPGRRAAIEASDKPIRELPRKFGVSEDTIRRWRK